MMYLRLTILCALSVSSEAGAWGEMKQEQASSGGPMVWGSDGTSRNGSHGQVLRKAVS